MKCAVFIGRWQPWHYGHAWLIDQKLSKGISILILVRDTEVTFDNPFPTETTVAMIRKVYADMPVSVMVIPDIESVNYGRGVGYEVNEHKPPDDIKRISASGIRDCIQKKDDSWKDNVNPLIWTDIETVLS